MTKGETKKEEARRRLAVVRVRGSVHMKPQIKKTFEMLKLTEPNHCVVIDSRPEYMGMVMNIKDYVTWGEVSQAALEKLLNVRGRVQGGRLSDAFMEEKTSHRSIGDFAKAFMEFKAELEDVPAIKKTFRLNPPKKGFERFGIKKPYSTGGALGYRGEKINGLLERMI